MDVAWFKKQQKIRGVTADEIADRIGRNRSAISHIYSGQRRMSLEWAQAFAAALDQPIDEVLRRAGAIRANPGPDRDLQIARHQNDLHRALDTSQAQRLAGWATFVACLSGFVALIIVALMATDTNPHPNENVFASALVTIGAWGALVGAGWLADITCQHIQAKRKSAFAHLLHYRQDEYFRS